MSYQHGNGLEDYEVGALEEAGYHEVRLVCVDGAVGGRKDPAVPGEIAHDRYESQHTRLCALVVVARVLSAVRQR